MEKSRRRRWRTPKESFDAMTEWDGDCLIWKGATAGFHYGQITVSYRKIMAHRFVWEQENGPIPEGMTIDHLCHTPLCVNIKHLRLATPAQNSQNRKGAKAGTRSGIRNVHWDKSRKRWRVFVEMDGKAHYGGQFTDKHEAGEAARLLRKRLAQRANS